MNRKERVDLNRAKRRSVWLFLFLICSLYWIKCLYEDMDSINFNNILIQNSITIKDTIIVNLNKKVDSLKNELKKPVEVIPLPKPKRLKKVDTSHVDTTRIILPVLAGADSIK